MLLIFEASLSFVILFTTFLKKYKGYSLTNTYSKVLRFILDNLKSKILFRLFLERMFDTNNVKLVFILVVHL